MKITKKQLKRLIQESIDKFVGSNKKVDYLSHKPFGKMIGDNIKSYDSFASSSEIDDDFDDGAEDEVEDNLDIFFALREEIPEKIKISEISDTELENEILKFLPDFDFMPASYRSILTRYLRDTSEQLMVLSVNEDKLDDIYEAYFPGIDVDDYDNWPEGAYILEETLLNINDNFDESEFDTLPADLFYISRLDAGPGEFSPFTELGGDELGTGDSRIGYRKFMDTYHAFAPEPYTFESDIPVIRMLRKLAPNLRTEIL